MRGNASLRINKEGRKVKTSKKKLRWNQYSGTIKDNSPVLIIPFSLEDDISIKIADGIYAPYTSLTNFLVFQKDGKYQYEVVTRIPDMDWVQGKVKEFSGTVIVEDIYGQFIKGYSYKDGKIWKITQGNPNLRNAMERICTYKDWYTCYSPDGAQYSCVYNYTEEIGCIDVQDIDHDKFVVLDGKWYPKTGVPSDFYTSVGYIPTAPGDTGPGQRLCASTFNFQGSFTSASYNTNVSGMQFEDGYNVNRDNRGMIFSINNGVTDASMNQSPFPDLLMQGKTSAQYLREVFPSLFANNEIRTTYVDGVKVWQFTPFAVSKICGTTSNLATMVVNLKVPGSALPGNVQTWEDFQEIATNFIKSFIPGSRIYRGFLGTSGTTNSLAQYGNNCP